MNREILFRGQDIQGNWVEGFYFKDYKSVKGWTHDVIMFTDNDGVKRRVIVHRHTVGQFTGLTDNNNVKIFEGDIVEVSTKVDINDDFMEEPIMCDQSITTVVEYREEIASFDLQTIESDAYLKDWGFYGEEFAQNMEVVGSIHDKKTSDDKKK